MYFLQKGIGGWAYAIPLVLLSPSSAYLFGTITGERAMPAAWLWLPLFISSLVYTTGFFVYRKWINKAK